MSNFIKSPLVYQGSKFRLLEKLSPIFPKNINNFYDVFGGSGTLSLNVEAKHIHYNELNYFIFRLMSECFNKPDKVLETVKEIHSTYNLIASKEKDAQERYNIVRDILNNEIDPDSALYICYIIYLHNFSINSLIRFNKNGKFNASFGFMSGGVYATLESKLLNCKKSIRTYNQDFAEFLTRDWEEDDFVYLDPPYLNTTAVYNENRLTGWSINDDLRLFDKLDELSRLGVKFAISNVRVGKNGVENSHLIEWATRNNFTIYDFNHKYASFGNSNKNSSEILITNY